MNIKLVKQKFIYRRCAYAGIKFIVYYLTLKNHLFLFNWYGITIMVTLPTRRPDSTLNMPFVAVCIFYLLGLAFIEDYCCCFQI